MLIKFFLGIAIVIFTSFCGYLLARKYRQRMLFFQEFCVFNERFLSEIAYYRRPVKEFIALYSYRGEFNDFLAEIFTVREENLELESLFSKDKYTFLKEEEKKTLTDYFFMLGKGDSASQKGYFSSVKEKLLSMQKEAETQAKRYGDLYIKIGFLCGLLILILIV